MKSAKINFLKLYPVLNLSISLITLIVQTFLSFSGYCLKGINCWEPNFSLKLFSRKILLRFYSKTGNPIQQKILTVRIFAKKPILWKSKAKHLNWVFASSIVQWSERLLNFIQSIEWIVSIKKISNIEWVPIFKDFTKNIWSIILEKTCHNFDSHGTYTIPFKFNFEQLKDNITVDWRNTY